MATFLNDVRCFLLDMDGTFFLGNELLPGALDFMAALAQKGIDYLFLTNNSSKHAGLYAEKIRKLGFNVPVEKIFTSGEATTIYLNKLKPGAKVYLVGTQALEDEFRRSGFELTADDPDYAVLGFDTSLTYEKLTVFCDLVRAGKTLYRHPSGFQLPGAEWLYPGHRLLHGVDRSFHRPKSGRHHRQTQCTHRGRGGPENRILEGPDRHDRRPFIHRYRHGHGRHQNHPGAFGRDQTGRSQNSPFQPDLIADNLGDIFKSVDKIKRAGVGIRLYPPG